MSKSALESKLRKILRPNVLREKKDSKNIEQNRLDSRKRDKIELNSREFNMNKKWNKKELKEKSVSKNTELSKIVSDLNVKLNLNRPRSKKK